jgi:hypothetical protein
MSGGFEVMIRWIAEDLAALLSISTFVAAVLLVADAVTTARSPASITTIAPPCADARQPCRGRAS